MDRFPPSPGAQTRRARAPVTGAARVRRPAAPIRTACSPSSTGAGCSRIRRPDSPRAWRPAGRSPPTTGSIRPVRRSTSGISSRSSGCMHIQRHGGRPVVVVGGGTGMIGDPSGRSAERNLLDRASRSIANTAAIRAQLEHFLDFSAGSRRRRVVVDNLDWLGTIGLLEFLRDVGKHFTVPYMLAKDSVQDAAGRRPVVHRVQLHAPPGGRLPAPLPDELGVELQTGGADQWGNITAGLELIRRGRAAEARTGARTSRPTRCRYPLLLSPSTAQKFGKTAEGTSVWLDPARTSPYAFYQFWLDADDAEVGGYLRLFTLLDRDEIEALEAEQRRRPERAADPARARARPHRPGPRGGEARPTSRRSARRVFSRRRSRARRGDPRRRLRAARTRSCAAPTSPVAPVARSRSPRAVRRRTARRDALIARAACRSTSELAVPAPTSPAEPIAGAVPDPSGAARRRTGSSRRRDGA